jgi:hypothetical protein
VSGKPSGGLCFGYSGENYEFTMESELSAMATTALLALFDHFSNHHKARCAVDSVLVEFDRRQSSTRVLLMCPRCRKTISGSIAEVDEPAVTQLLSPPKTC